jgi:hypothetical protein
VNRLDIINNLAKKINAKTYLEIGVFKGYVFNNVAVDHKCGVDPNPFCVATIYTTSDLFFKNNKETFDLIFIDGLHTKEQVFEDINNALGVLNSGGYIVCHDMNPDREILQKVPRETDEWTGDCWKAWVDLRSSRSDLSMFVVDTDYGCGIISKGSQNTPKIDCDINWNNFVKYRTTWLNLISVEKFMRLL